jgi:hypothetical protein
MQCNACDKDLYGPVKYCDTCDLPVCDDCMLPVYGYYAEHYKVDVTSTPGHK